MSVIKENVIVIAKCLRLFADECIYSCRCAERKTPSPPLQTPTSYDYHSRTMPSHSSGGSYELGVGPSLHQHSTSPLVYDHLGAMGGEALHAGMMGREGAYGFGIHPSAYYDPSQCHALPVSSTFSAYSSASSLTLGNSPPTGKSPQSSPSGRCPSDDGLVLAKPKLVEITPMVNSADHKNASYVNLQNAWRKRPTGDAIAGGNSDDDVTCQQERKRCKITGSGDPMNACHEQSPEQTVPGTAMGRSVICPRGNISMYSGNVTSAMGYSPDSYSLEGLPNAPGYYNYYAQAQTDSLASCPGYS